MFAIDLDTRTGLPLRAPCGDDTCTRCTPETVILFTLLDSEEPGDTRSGLVARFADCFGEEAMRQEFDALVERGLVAVVDGAARLTDLGQTRCDAIVEADAA